MSQSNDQTTGRTAAQWRGMKPEAVVSGSPAQVLYCIKDAQHDILALQELLSEGLDLCVRARKLDEPIMATEEMWERNPTMTRSMTPSLWVLDQYDRDLADWEARARKALP